MESSYWKTRGDKSKRRKYYQKSKVIPWRTKSKTASLEPRVTALVPAVGCGLLIGESPADAQSVTSALLRASTATICINPHRELWFVIPTCVDDLFSMFHLHSNGAATAGFGSSSFSSFCPVFEDCLREWSLFSPGWKPEAHFPSGLAGMWLQPHVTNTGMRFQLE